ncbi:MAG: potassium transporter TrkG, partial [Deltaproteobacteria bacterium]
MSSFRSGGDGVSRRLRFRAIGRHLLFSMRPARLLALGYLSYMLAGWLLLSLPFAREVPLRLIDTLFTAVSAVSTTGLTTVDTAGSYSFAGEFIVLVLIQLGGLGYMTVSSFAFLSLRQRLSGARKHTTQAVFGLPVGINAARFVRAVVVFTLICEATGALALWYLFHKHGIDNALWQGVFHAISAFCTAGFSLFSTSVEGFRGDMAINWVISILSLFGALGFIVVVDAWQWLRSEKRIMGYSSAVIWRFSFFLIIGATFVLALREPGISSLPDREIWMAAFFQSMSAATTVGFNSVPIAAISPQTAVILIVLMLIGASPAGTGGGLKTTTFAALFAQMISVARGRPQTILMGQRVPEARMRLASASLSLYLAMLLAALILLLAYEPGVPLLALVFESVSALSTVGLSMGITGTLGDMGKAIIIVLMYVG